MKLEILSYQQQFSVPLEEAWRFFVDPHNLATITPPELGLKVTSQTDSLTYAGQIITYTVTPYFGIPIRWITEITHLQEPFLFVDEQRFGPYRFWHHQHRFSKGKNGGTIVEDRVHYMLPAYPLGSLMVGRIVRSKLENIFAFRSKVLKERLGSK